MHSRALAAMMATESEGVTKKRRPRIMLRSPSPSEAAPGGGRGSDKTEMRGEGICESKSDAIVAMHVEQVHQLLGVCEVGVRVALVEVLHGDAVLDRGGGGTQGVDEQGLGVRAWGE